MKLIELYIENFGGLRRYSLKFQDGMTVIEEPNGKDAGQKPPAEIYPLERGQMRRISGF